MTATPRIYHAHEVSGYPARFHDIRPPNGTDTSDDAYVTASRRWWVESFLPYYARWLEAHRLCKYIKNRRDCDKYTHWAVSVARLLHSISYDGDAGLAVGEFWYRPSGDQLPIFGTAGHASVIALVKSTVIHEGVPETLKPLHLEVTPPLGLPDHSLGSWRPYEIKLTKNERDTCVKAGF